MTELRPDAIAAAYASVFTAEELRQMRKDVQLCKCSFVLCAEIERSKVNDDGNERIETRVVGPQ